MRRGQILILIRQNFHVEDLREVIGRTGGTGALRSTLSGVLANGLTGDKIRNAIFSGDRNVELAIDMFRVWKE